MLASHARQLVVFGLMVAMIVSFAEAKPPRRPENVVLIYQALRISTADDCRVAQRKFRALRSWSLHRRVQRQWSVEPLHAYAKYRREDAE